MYNRYIPQSDGTYRRRPTAENVQQGAPSPPPEPKTQDPEPTAHPSHDCEGPRQTPGGVGNFLRQILPKGFDVGDLIVVLLLLLMAADCQEDQNTALLTLALYLFL